MFFILSICLSYLIFLAFNALNKLKTLQWYCLEVIPCSLYIHSYSFYFGSFFVLFFGGISLFSSQNYVILNTERVLKLLTASAKFTI